MLRTNDNPLLCKNCGNGLFKKIKKSGFLSRRYKSLCYFFKVLKSNFKGLACNLGLNMTRWARSK
ncbi:hypothetical protein F7212_03310 [Helicobacter pylori]|nr:hypothetical protein [Helicobacter pylori]